jgi:uncharacterized protein
VTEPDRITAIDVLRGVALLGILVMNIQLFAMPTAALANPTAFGDLSGANWWTWLLSRLLADQKFMTLFSMLFGAGIVLMTSRVAARGGAPARFHYRRMLWLLLFGLAHAYLLWDGDILVLYAVCGLLLYPCRTWSPRALLALGLGALAIGSGLSLVTGWQLLSAPESVIAMFAGDWQPSTDALSRELAAYRGGWLTQLPQRAAVSFEFHAIDILAWGLWRAGGLMLIGMALFKLDVFGARRTRAFYALLAAIGVLGGLPIVAYGIHLDIAARWDMRFSEFFGDQFNYWGSLPVALGYTGLVMLLCGSDALKGLGRRLEAVGRMAFTNYLVQSIVCTTIFYGHGLGLFGRVSRTGQIAIVAGVWLVELYVSPIWLRHFHMGPFEWIWRALTYGTLPPFQRRASTDS